MPLRDKKATSVARALVERVFSVFSPPEKQHSDQGTEFKNELVKELQSVFGFKKTRTSAYRPQGNSVLQRVHSTMHNTPAMYANVQYDNWAESFRLCNSCIIRRTTKLSMRLLIF